MIYKECITSKNGFSVPLYSDGMPSSSKYDPVREVISFGQDINTETGFFVIAGIAGAFHIDSLLKKFPESKIICVEEDKESLDFCLKNSLIKTLDCSNLILCTKDELEQVFISNYIPSLYGDFSFLYLRTWADKNKSSIEFIYNKIQSLLKIISADYSVQCHFGKIWQRNILLNLRTLYENNSKAYFSLTQKDLNKTAAVIAAGPSLDESINELKQNRNNYFIFSTDTSYKALLKQDIIPDAVVSIDGQSISSSHFYKCSKDTQFVFDLCASSAAIKKVIDSGNNFLFINTGHPLSNTAANYVQFPEIYSGSGTVTIASCDFALKCGFTKIKFYGNDFCYSSGKPYTKGTYLDENFFNKANTLTPADNDFTNLMYRTETKIFTREKYSYKNLKSPFTTDVLDSYRNSLDEWIKDNNGIFNDEYFLFNRKPIDLQLKQNRFDYNNFISTLLNTIKSYNESEKNISSLFPFLPYYAYEKSKISKQKKLSVFDFLKLEYKTILRYTCNYETK